MEKIMMTALAAAMASSVAVAEVTVPNTFVQGTNAVAEDVNANFQALAAAIDESNSRIAALEEQLEAAKSLDVSGSNYAVQSSSASVRIRDANPSGTDDFSSWGVDLFSEKFSLTFNADTDKTVTLEFEIEQEGDLDNGFRLSIEEDSEPVTETLYWNQEGNRLQIAESLGGEPVVEFVVVEGASVIYSADTESVRNENLGHIGCGEQGLDTCYEDYFDNGTLVGIGQTSTQ